MNAKEIDYTGLKISVSINTWNILKKLHMILFSVDKSIQAQHNKSHAWKVSGDKN
jgi:hypothetical protein